MVVAEEAFSKFAEETKLHGFAYVRNKQKVIAAVWICLIGCAFALTLNDFVNLIITYQSEPTTVGVSIETNENLIVPTPTLCMEIVVNNKSPNESEIANDVDLFLTATKNAENLQIESPEDLQLSDQLEYYTYIMLDYITDLELNSIGEQFELFTNYVLHASDYNNKGINQSVVRQIYDIYMKRNVSLSNLKRLIGMSLCKKRMSDVFMFRYVANDSTSESQTFCKPSMITHLSFGLLCSKLAETSQLQFYQNLANTVGIYGMKTQYYGYMAGDVNPEGVPKQNINFNYHVDLQGRESLPTTNNMNIFTINPFNTYWVDVSVSAEYQFYNAKLRPCLTTETNFICNRKRQAVQMQKSCGCVPTQALLESNATREQSCSDNPAKLLTDLFGHTTCKIGPIESCPKDCRALIFNVVRRVTTVETKAFNTLDDSWISFVEFTYRRHTVRSIITETNQNTWATFMSQFGGSIGTWLGASLLAFIHIPFFIITTYWDSRKRKEQNRQKQDVVKISTAENLPVPTVKQAEAITLPRYIA